MLATRRFGHCLEPYGDLARPGRALGPPQGRDGGMISLWFVDINSGPHRSPPSACSSPMDAQSTPQRIQISAGAPW